MPKFAMSEAIIDKLYDRYKALSPALQANFRKVLRTNLKDLGCLSTDPANPDEIVLLIATDKCNADPMVAKMGTMLDETGLGLSRKILPLKPEDRVSPPSSEKGKVETWNAANLTVHCAHTKNEHNATLAQNLSLLSSFNPEGRTPEILSAIDSFDGLYVSYLVKEADRPWVLTKEDVDNCSPGLDLSVKIGHLFPFELQFYTPNRATKLLDAMWGATGKIAAAIKAGEYTFPLELNRELLRKYIGDDAFKFSFPKKDTDYNPSFIEDTIFDEITEILSCRGPLPEDMVEKLQTHKKEMVEVYKDFKRTYPDARLFLPDEKAEPNIKLLTEKLLQKLYPEPTMRSTSEWRQKYNEIRGPSDEEQSTFVP